MQQQRHLVTQLPGAFKLPFNIAQLGVVIFFFIQVSIYLI